MFAQFLLVQRQLVVYLPLAGHFTSAWQVCLPPALGPPTSPLPVFPLCLSLSKFASPQNNTLPHPGKFASPLPWASQLHLCFHFLFTLIPLSLPLHSATLYLSLASLPSSCPGPPKFTFAVIPTLSLLQMELSAQRALIPHQEI